MNPYQVYWQDNWKIFVSWLFCFLILLTIGLTLEFSLAHLSNDLFWISSMILLLASISCLVPLEMLIQLCNISFRQNRVENQL